MAKRLTQLRVSEISLVDRPANPGARVVLAKRADEPEEYWKRDFTQEQRDAAAKEGAALPDGSFPIKTKADLHNAMQAIGRAKNPGKAKAHIRSRAKTLGLTSELSDAFKSASPLAVILHALVEKAAADSDARDFDDIYADGDTRDFAEDVMCEINECVCALGQSFHEILCDDDTPDKLKALKVSLKQFLAQLAEGDFSKGDTMTPELKKALGLAADASEADFAKALGVIVGKVAATETELAATKAALNLAKMSEKHSNFMAADGAKMPKGGKDAFAAMSADDRDKHMADNPISKSAGEIAAAQEIAKANATATEALAKVAKMEDAAALADVAKRIEAWGGTAEHASILHALAKSDKTAAEKMEATLKGLAEQVKTGKVFAEFGTKQQTQGTAKGAVEARVAELRKSDPKLADVSDDRLMLKLAESKNPADRELWKRYREETDGKRAA